MDLVATLDAVQQEVTTRFSPLSVQQLNWKPSAEKWSIAQCLAHLANSNKSYFPAFDKILEGSYKLPFLQRVNPLKKIWGPLMVRQLGPQPLRKLKAPKIFQPAASDFPLTVVSDFANEQQRLRTYFFRLQELDAENIVMASPVTNFITYSVADAMRLLAGHEQRHFSQAVNVLFHPNFPKES